MVASVIGAAWRHGTVRVSLDAGAFHGLIEALESGRELRFPVTIPAAGQRMLVPCTLTGPSCDSQDTIMDLVWLPEPRAGDQVLIGNAGCLQRLPGTGRQDRPRGRDNPARSGS